MTLEDKLERVELALTRWHSRLYRTANTIRKLDAARKRLVERIAERQAPRPAAAPEPGLNDSLDEILAPVADELGIPGFLDRRPNAADEAAKAEILAQRKDAKKQKAVVRRAKQNDRFAKMPLSGKAALEAIRG